MRILISLYFQMEFYIGITLNHKDQLKMTPLISAINLSINQTGCQRHIILTLVDNVDYFFMTLHLHAELVTVNDGTSKLPHQSILMYLPMSRSNQNIFRSYAEALAERGHHVTMVLPDSSESKLSGHAEGYNIPHGSIHEIQIKCDDSVTVLMSSWSQNISSHDCGSFCRTLLMLKGLQLFSRYIRACHTAALLHSEIQDIMQKDRKMFDLVIVSALCNEIGYFLAHKINAPLILLLTNNINPVLTLAMGYSDNPAFLSWI